MKSDPNDLLNDTDPPLAVPVIPEVSRAFARKRLPVVGPRSLPKPAPAMRTWWSRPADRSRYEAAFARFASVFPGRLLRQGNAAATFPTIRSDKRAPVERGVINNTMGYFRDDTPLSELILDEKGQKELERASGMNSTLSAITHSTHVDSVLFQPERGSSRQGCRGWLSAPSRSPDHRRSRNRGDARCLSCARLRRIRRTTLVAPEAIRDHFSRVNTTLRNLEKERKLTPEPKHLEALLRFAARAYRRPLTKAEHDDFLEYYHTLRTTNEMSHEDATPRSRSPARADVARFPLTGSIC